MRLRDGYIVVEHIRLTCSNCGFPIDLLKFADGVQVWQPHWYCDKPSVSLISDNPRKLGTITAL